MEFYFGVFFILAILSFIEEFSNFGRMEKVVHGICFIVIIFISGIRCGEAGDYEAYKLVFDQTDINQNVIKSIISVNTHSTEWGYNLLNYICKSIYNNYQFFIIMEAILVNTLLLVVAKWFFENKFWKKKYIVTFLWINWSLGLFNIIIVRQTIAVMICWISIRYIEDKKPLKFILFVLIATLVHRTSLLWVLAYFIYSFDTRNKRFKYILQVYLLTVVGCIAVRPIATYLPGMLGIKLRYYLDSGIISYGESYNVFILLTKSILNVGLLLIIFSVINRKNIDNKYMGFFNLYVFGSAIIVGSCFLSNELARLATAFSMLSIFLLLYFIKTSYELEKKLVVYFFMVAYLGTRLFVYINGSYSLVDGYENILKL